ncbi:MAG: hypothetical protein K2K96_12925 [Lachnospiraceae bacterium]|nr:hypothetical protein [Lachnospiraceae bacterium]
MKKIIFYHQIFAAVMMVILLFTMIPIPVKADEVTIEIHTVADFWEFAENCKTDGWSIGKVVVLKNDLDISGIEFDGIAYFNGTFRGCGYTISFLSMEPVGSHYGFFRYIGSMGLVRDLNVHGSTAPTGSASMIGGIAGVNQGMILNCSYTGNVRGKNEVGGIAGYNAETGMILNSTNYAMVLATDQTGGIAGRNEGLISDCNNQGNINIKELDTTMDLGGVDIGTLNLAGNIVNRNNMGGIAGMSEGIITGCRNSGTIGFEHTGYNVGGIVGSQSGQIFDCTNEGTVYGRKDVGGIVGQASPFMEATYLSEKVESAQTRVSGLNNTLNSIVSSVSDTVEESRNYADQLRTQYQEEWQSVSQNLATILDTISENEAAAGQYRENIFHAMEAITSEGEHLIMQEQELDLEDLWEQGLEQDELQDMLAQISENRISDQTEESARRIRDQLQIINENLQLIREQYEIDEESEEELKTSLQEELQNNSRAEDIDQFVEIIERGSKEASEGMNSMMSQINSALDAVDVDMTILRERGFIEDVSGMAFDPDAKGVISGCINSGSVNGDINAGGIAGTMNIEYGSDPETDFSFAGDVNIVLRTTLNDVIMDCKNFGTVRVKKNHAGGIVGGQILGLVYSCEAYGYVIAATGDELGGIAGYSEAAVRGCYSLCSMEGQDRIGGICGYGSTIENCISICDIKSEGECRGAIAGEVDEEGSRIGNFFVSDTLEGIDGISYLGIAEHSSHDNIMQMAGIPDDFHQIRVTFMADETIIEEQQKLYGYILREEDFPEIPEKEGYYAQWDYNDMPLLNNEMFIAEYIPWVEALASEEKMEDGRMLMLAVGEFYQEDVLHLNEMAAASQVPLTEQDTLLYMYAWEIEMSKQHVLPAELECHFAVSEPGRTKLYLFNDGAWTLIPTTEDGSYLVASLPYGASFALVESDAGISYAAVIAAGGALLVIAVIAAVRKKRRKEH